jgi:hypothetical protein
VDDFGVKYVGKEHADHLIASLQDLYSITIEWDGTLYCGTTFKWNYEKRHVDLSMPGYVAKALHRFQHPRPSKPQDSPYPWNKPDYGSKVQLSPLPDTTTPLDAASKTRLQEIVGTLLYYARAVDSIMLVALGSLAAAQSKGTQATVQACTQLLNYAEPRIQMPPSATTPAIWSY